MINIIVSNTDYLRALRIAQARNDIKVRNNIPCNILGDHKFNDPLQLHIIGVLAELAAAYWLDTDIDEDVLIAGDKGAPDLFKNGYSFEVKHREHFYGDFIIPKDWNDAPEGAVPEFRADIGILSVKGPAPNIVCLKKWFWKKDFLDKFHVKDYGKGDRAALSQRHMRDMAELKRLMLRVA